jgi:hypothetical protein
MRWPVSISRDHPFERLAPTSGGHRRQTLQEFAKHSECRVSGTRSVRCLNFGVQNSVLTADLNAGALDDRLRKALLSIHISSVPHLQDDDNEIFVFNAV